MTEDPQGTPPEDPREEPGNEPQTDPPSAVPPEESSEQEADSPREEPGDEQQTDPPSAVPAAEADPPAEESTFGADAVSGENALEAEPVPPAASQPAGSAEDAVPGRLGSADTPTDPAPAEALPVDPSPADAVPDASPDVALDPDVDTTLEASEQLEPEQARGFDPPADARDVVDARRGDAPQQSTDEAIPGAHLEPDLVLEDQPRAEDQFDRYEEGAPQTAASDPPPAPDGAPARRTPLDLAADARYRATGKRKTSVARVILRPGTGAYVINGRTLDQFFPRPTLQRTARLPLETAGYETRMDVVARIHGGGVSSQAGALRHGIARALVEADPNLRTDLKRRGFLTRDARAKERKKAGLKKARKRPQFSKR